MDLLDTAYIIGVDLVGPHLAQRMMDNTASHEPDLRYSLFSAQIGIYLMFNKPELLTTWFQSRLDL